MHKITSNLHDMRKILIKKFWSQGTLLGVMGSGSQKALTQGACQYQIPLTWSPWGPPELVLAQAQAKTLCF